MRPPRYSTLLVDLDHTLLDSDASELEAFDHSLAGVGIPTPRDHLDAYSTINADLWSAVERGELDPEKVRFVRFERLVELRGLDARPAELADRFADGLKTFGDLFPGVGDVLASLSGVARMALVTNGVSDVQRARIERLDLARFFDAIVISSEIGSSKPGSQIFAAAFAALGEPDRDSSLMVGDSLTSDMQGGVDFGMSTCWFNPHGATRPGGLAITHEITDMKELVDVVVGG